MQVVALVHEENGVYGVSFPDFPGCTTVADTLDQVVTKAAQVLAFHADGMVEDGLALPAARSLDQLRRDPEFCSDAEGALVALIPLTPPSHAVRINITVEESLLARTDRAAAAAGETRSGFIADALRLRLAALE